MRGRAQKPSIFSGWLPGKPTQHRSQRPEQALEYSDLDLPSPGKVEASLGVEFGYGVWVFHQAPFELSVEDFGDEESGDLGTEENREY